jgi:hypothetical protein
MFLGEWSSLDDILKDFRANIDTSDIEILFAVYTYESYDGRAFVLYKDRGSLYEVNGSHCSCYGLEDQWEPEETSVEAIVYRLDIGRMERNIGEYCPQLRQVLVDLAQ